MSFKRNTIEWWKNSKLFKCVDSVISGYYQRRLTNDNFSIICSNCVGGVVCHRFGKQFLSPTVNMFIDNTDFVDFLENIEYYLSLEPVFVDMGEAYPTAVIGDGEHKKITLHFNHDNDAGEARNKWDKRKKRVNYDNMYIMMYNLDGLTTDNIKRVEKLPKSKFRNKVIFTSKPLPDVDWSCYIKPVLKDNYPYAYLQKNFLGIRRVERHFDLIKFLNTR